VMLGRLLSGYLFAILLGFCLITLFGEVGAAFVAVLFASCLIQVFRRPWR
jgi:hypothetical protein